MVFNEGGAQVMDALRPLFFKGRRDCSQNIKKKVDPVGTGFSSFRMSLHVRPYRTAAWSGRPVAVFPRSYSHRRRTVIPRERWGCYFSIGRKRRHVIAIAPHQRGYEPRDCSRGGPPLQLVHSEGFARVPLNSLAQRTRSRSVERCKTEDYRRPDILKWEH